MKSESLEAARKLADVFGRKRTDQMVGGRVVLNSFMADNSDMVQIVEALSATGWSGTPGRYQEHVEEHGV